MIDNENNDKQSSESGNSNVNDILTTTTQTPLRIVDSTDGASIFKGGDHSDQQSIEKKSKSE